MSYRLCTSQLGLLEFYIFFYSQFKITFKKLGAFPNSCPLPKGRSTSLLFFILVTGTKLWLLDDNIFNCFEESNTVGHGKVLTRTISLLLTTVHQSIAWLWMWEHRAPEPCFIMNMRTSRNRVLLDHECEDTMQQSMNINMRIILPHEPYAACTHWLKHCMLPSIECDVLGTGSLDQQQTTNAHI